MIQTDELAEVVAELESDWKLWALHLMRPYLTNRKGELVWFAPHHEEFWRFVWTIEPGETPNVDGRRTSSIAAVWPRGHAKSTTVEMGVAALAARGTRKYGLYVSGTQAQADAHLANVAAMITSQRFAQHYPDVANRKITQFGRGQWKQNRLQTASGFTLDSAGLDVAIRGLKQEEQRPDLIVFDDVDDINDGATVTNRKELAITRSILPARSNDAVVMFVQNLILEDGVMDRIVQGRADYLRGMHILGPYPAVQGLQYEGRDDGRWHITAGQPTWMGMDLEDCEEVLNTIGPSAFLAELQHETRAVSDRVYPQFDPETHQYLHRDLPPFRVVVGGLDFGGEGNTANETAGLVAGVDVNDRVILLSEFKDNGENVSGRLMEWMQEQEQRWKGPGSIIWAADATEELGIRMMIRVGFNVHPSQRGGRESIRESRVSMVGTRLELDPQGRPALSYLPSLVAYEQEMLRYRRQQPRFDGDPRRRDIIKVNDHLMTCQEYLIEMLDGPGSNDLRPKVGKDRIIF